MCFLEDLSTEQGDIKLSSVALRRVDTFKYLGVEFSCNGRWHGEIDRKMAERRSVQHFTHYSISFTAAFHSLQHFPHCRISLTVAFHSSISLAVPLYCDEEGADASDVDRCFKTTYRPTIRNRTTVAKIGS